MTQMNIRPIIYGTLTMLAVLLPTGCTSDESPDTSNVVQFVTGMEQAVTRSSTRDNMWNTTDRVAITDETEVKMYKPTAEGASIALEKDDTEAQPFYWAIGKGDMTFSAWSPYTATNESMEVAVAADQRATSSDPITDSGTLTDAAFSAYDLLYAPPITAASGTSVPLQFYHQMAHIVVYIIGVATDQHQDPLTGLYYDNGEKEEITSVVLGSDAAKIALSGTLTRRGVTGQEATEANEAKWSVNAATSTITMRDMDTQAGQVVAGYKKRRIYECILPPQSGGTNPEYEYDPTTKQWKVKSDKHGTVLLTFYTTSRNGDNPYRFESAFDYKGGYQYVYYIGLQRAGLYVAYKVDDWASVETNGASSIFNYMDHPGAFIADWTAPGNTITGNLGKFD